MKKIICALALLLAFTLIGAACGRREIVPYQQSQVPSPQAQQVTPEPKPTPEQSQEPENSHVSMTPVVSSALSAVGYERGTLYIEFTSGSLYEYYDVPASVYRELMNAESLGKYFNANIKGVYEYSRIS